MATLDHPVKIANGDTKDVTGPVTFIRLHTTTGALKITVNDKTTSLLTGQSIALDRPVDKFSITNDSGSDITALLKLGDGARIEDNQLSGNVTVTKATGQATAPDVTVPANTTAIVMPTNSARRYALVTALDTNANTARVGDLNAAAARGTPCAAGQTARVEGTAAVYVYAPAGAALTFALSEVVD